MNSEHEIYQIGGGYVTLNDSFRDFFVKLSRGPAYLLLGQEYLKFETGSDFLLEETVSKFGEKQSNVSGYDAIFSTKAKDYPENTIAWMQERCDRIVVPDWMKIIAGYQWCGIYTSAIDNLIIRAFRNEWRNIRCIFNEDIRFEDMRNRKQLACTFLYGCVNSEESESRPPLDRKELNRRNLKSVSLLKRLPELITPIGMLLIDGYAGKHDWLKIAEHLEVIVEELEHGQTHIFSVTDELRYDFETETELLSTGKIVLHEESLAGFFMKGEADGYLKLGESPEEEVFKHRIRINQFLKKVPTEIWNVVSKSALIVDEMLFSKSPAIRAEEVDKKYQEFRRFLSEGSTTPIWTGYREDRKFAFQRDYEYLLWDFVQEKIDSGVQVAEPILLYGQTGSGKTITLGSLACRLYQQGKFPVLFIERKLQLPNEEAIDLFCTWAENNGAEGVVIIWDGMCEFNKYHSLLKFLNGRGRRPVILIGSSYMISQARVKKELGRNISLVRAEAKLNIIPNDKAGGYTEIERFKIFLTEVDAGMKETFEVIAFNDSFLVSLYRWLPATRNGINEGLKEEVRQAANKIQELGKMGRNHEPMGSLAFALQKHERFKMRSLLSEEVVVVDDEKLSDAEFLFGLILIPGSFGLDVPFDLLIRSIGKEKTGEYLKLIENTDLFRYKEDEVGNIFIIVREMLEAALVVNNGKLSLINTKLEFIKILISNMANNDLEVQFIIELVRELGPNNKKSIHRLPGRLNPWPVHPKSNDALWCYYQLAKMLGEVRENHFANPKLILQEATLLRESLLGNDVKPNAVDILGKAEEILKRVLGDETVINNKKQRLTMLVELASILGTRIKYMVKNTLRGDRLEIKNIFVEVNECLNIARKIDPSATYPAAALSWIVLAVLEANVLNNSERLSAITSVLKTFEAIEGENLSDVNDLIFHNKRLRFAELVGREDISEAVLAELNDRGSCDGYFFISKKIFPQVESDVFLSDEELVKCHESWCFLESKRNDIKHASDCLIRLLRLFWLYKTKMKLFSEEYQAIPFNNKDWKYCQEIINDLESCGHDIKESPSILYLKGIIQFHLDDICGAMDSFKKLGYLDSEHAWGRKRTRKFYVVTDGECKPKACHGFVCNLEADKGWIKVEEYRGIKVPFLYRDYYGLNPRIGESFSEYYLAFNFRGLIVVPAHVIRGRKRDE